VHGRNAAAGLLALRLIIGWLFLWHGLGKLVGPPFPGEGFDWFSENLSFLVPSLGVLGAEAAAGLAVALEAGGGILLILGWQTALVTSALLIEVVAAIAVVRFELGLFGPAGWEQELMLAAALLCLLFGGPGAASLDLRRRGGGDSA
jgi:putative oxidoreductase